MEVIEHTDWIAKHRFWCEWLRHGGAYSVAISICGLPNWLVGRI